MPFWMRWIAFCLACLGPLLVARSAAAQASITVANVERKDRDNPYNLTEFQINRADCLAQDTITFTLTLFGVGNESIQVWEGMGCQTDTNRTGNNAPCRLIKDVDSGNTSLDITVPELLGAVATNGTIGSGEGGAGGAGGADGTGAVVEPGAGGAGAIDLSVCSPTSGDGKDQLNLHFLLVTGGDTLVAAAPDLTPFDVDLRGPGPPTQVELEVGDGALIVNFEASTDNAADIVGYNLYCEACSASALATGGDPPIDTDIYDCGQISSMTEEGQTTNLENGTSVRVRLSGRDGFGNVGPLSDGSCGTPELVTGFYEAYRAGGGQGGGGGICSLGGPGRRGLGAIGASAVLLLAAAVRRLRSTRRRS